MSETDATRSRLTEAVRLAGALSDRVLNSQLLGQEIPAEQVEALLKAADLFQDLGEPWPTMLTQALHEIADAAQESLPEAEEPSTSESTLAPPPWTSGDEGGIKGFIARARRRKS